MLSSILPLLANLPFRRFFASLVAPSPGISPRVMQQCSIYHPSLSSDLRTALEFSSFYLSVFPRFLLAGAAPTGDRYSSKTITENRGYLRDRERH